MKLIVITKPTYFVEEDQILTALFDEVLEILHLRKTDPAPVYAERLLTLIPEKYRKRIVVHGNFYLKDEYKLKGIHLNSHNAVIPNNYNGTITTSCHSLEEVKEKKPHFEYVFLSPVFDSISKEGYHASFTPEQIRTASKNNIIDKHVIALGGINENNILQVKDFGFGGCAILGGLWNQFDSEHDYNYNNLIEQFKKLKHLAD